MKSIDVNFPCSLIDLINSNNEEFQVTNVFDISDITEDDLISYITDISNISNVMSPYLDQNTLNNIYSISHNFSNISDSRKIQYIDTLINTANSLYKHLTNGNITDDIIISSKKISYLLASICHRISSMNLSHELTTVTTAANKKGKSNKSKSIQTFQLIDYEFNIITILNNFLLIDPSIIWTMSCIDTNYIIMIFQCSLQLLVSHTSIADKILKSLYTTILSNCINNLSNHSLTTITTILIDNILKFEIISQFFSNIVDNISDNCKKQLMNELFSEINNINMNNLSINNYKNINVFLDNYSKCHSKSMINHLSIILKLLDSPVHQIRSAIITVIGNLITYISNTLSNKTEKSIDPSNENEDEVINNNHDSGNENNNSLVLTNLKDSLYNILIERTHDMNYYTRSNVLKTFHFIIEQTSASTSTSITFDLNSFLSYLTNCFIDGNIDMASELTNVNNNQNDIIRFVNILETAYDRIIDKTSIVRKQAISLLISLLTNNPYTPHFNIVTYESIHDFIQQLMNQIQHKLKQFLDSEIDNKLDNQLDEKLDSNITIFLTNESINFDDLINYLSIYQTINKNIINIINIFHNSMKQLSSYLYSKNNTDIIETIRLFKSIIHFNAIDSAMYYRKSFQLVWHNDANVRKECIQSFYDVFISDGSCLYNNSDVINTNQTINPSNNILTMSEIINNIIKLLDHCNNNQNDIKSIEKILFYIFTDSYINVNEFSITLWSQIYSTIQSNFDNDYKQLSTLCQLLALLSTITSSIKTIDISDILPRSKMVTLLDYTFKCDLALLSSKIYYFNTIRYLAICLQYTSIDGNNTSGYLDIIVNGLVGFISGKLCHDNLEDTRKWFSVCEESIIALYHIHPSPDKLMSTVLVSIHRSIQLSNQSNLSSYIRFVYIIGQVVSSTLLYIESLAIKVKNIKGFDSRVDNKAVNKVDDNDNNIEDEMGLSISNDMEHERVYNNITEYQLVMNNLLSNYYPMIAHIILSNLKSTVSTNDQTTLLKEISCMTLYRFISTSNQLCEKYISLLFTILSNESNINIRISGMITIGDLAFRYPNTIEPWTDRIYARLYDVDPLVRYNSLLILCHLISHDMIKVKSHISYLSMSLTDSNENIRDLAHNFFDKLNERIPNPLLNYLGDVIGSITYDMITIKSDHSIDVTIQKDIETDNYIVKRVLTNDEYEDTMNYLLSFIKKDKFADSLLERLLTRIQTSSSINQRKLISFCLKELSITEKGVKKMLDMFRTMKEILYDNTVYSNVKSLINKTKKQLKSNKPIDSNSNDKTNEEIDNNNTTTNDNVINKDMKLCINELDQLLDVIYNDMNGIENNENVVDSNIDNDIENKIDNKSKLLKQKSIKTKSKVKASSKKSRKQIDDDDDCNDLDDELDNDIDIPVVKQVVNKKSSRHRTVLRDISNEE